MPPHSRQTPSTYNPCDKSHNHHWSFRSRNHIPLPAGECHHHIAAACRCWYTYRDQPGSRHRIVRLCPESRRHNEVIYSWGDSGRGARHCPDHHHTAHHLHSAAERHRHRPADGNWEEWAESGNSREKKKMRKLLRRNTVPMKMKKIRGRPNMLHARSSLGIRHSRTSPLMVEPRN